MGQGSVSRRFSFPGSFRKDRVFRGRKKRACSTSGDGQCEAGKTFQEDAVGKKIVANRRRAQVLLKQAWKIAARRRNGHRETRAQVVFLSSAGPPGASLRGPARRRRAKVVRADAQNGMANRNAAQRNRRLRTPRTFRSIASTGSWPRHHASGQWFCRLGREANARIHESRVRQLPPEMASTSVVQVRRLAQSTGSVRNQEGPDLRPRR